MPKRRNVLIGLGGSIALAGCSGETEDEEPEESEQENQADTAQEESNSSPEFVVRDYNIPETVTQPAAIDIEITFENISDTDGTLTDSVNFRTVGEDISLRAMHDIEIEISSGETAVWEYSVTPEGSGVLEFRYRDIEQEIIVAPESKAPRITEIELVSEWNEFGDVKEKAIDSVAIGDTGGIGVRYKYWHEDGTHAVTFEVELSDEDGTVVNVLQDQQERVADKVAWGDGWEWEWAQGFNTGSFTPGTYEATARLRDDVSGEVSDPASTTFEVTGNPQGRVIADATLRQSRVFTEAVDPSQRVEIEYDTESSVWLHVYYAPNSVLERELTGSGTVEIDIESDSIYYFSFAETREQAENEIFSGSNGPYEMPETDVLLTVYDT